jgi:hypothetical protein
MMLSAMVAAVLYNPAAGTFQEAAISARKMGDYEVRIEAGGAEYLIQNRSGQQVNFTYDEDGEQHLIYSTKSQFFHYRPSLNQHVAKVSENGGLANEIFAASGHLPPVVLGFLSPQGVLTLLDELSTSNDWTRRKNNRLMLEEGVGSSGTQLLFDEQFRLVAAAGKRFPHSVKISYAPLTTLDPGPPQTSSMVARFDRNVDPPIYADEAAQELGDRAVHALENLDQAAVSILDSGTETNIYVNGRTIRQTDQDADWNFDGRTLTVTELATKVVWSGSCKPGDLVDTVAKAGTRVDPVLRMMMRRRSFLRPLFSKAEVSIIGEITVEGKTAVIMNVEAEDAIHSVIIRRDDAMVLSLSSAIRMNDGTTAPSSSRRFKWMTKQKAIEAAVESIAVPPGYESRKLSDLGS